MAFNAWLHTMTNMCSASDPSHVGSTQVEQCRAISGRAVMELGCLAQGHPGSLPYHCGDIILSDSSYTCLKVWLESYNKVSFKGVHFPGVQLETSHCLNETCWCLAAISSRCALAANVGVRCSVFHSAVSQWVGVLVESDPKKSQ